MSSQTWTDNFPVFPGNLELTALAQPALEHATTAARGLRVVCFGGGTGLSTLLRGLKHYVALPGEAVPAACLRDSAPCIERLTAVVAVSDNGGSSGRLRSEFQVLPPGDIRNCLVALADDEALLSRMFCFRFDRGNGLEGHSFGNLFLTVLAELTSDFVEAVNLACAMLQTRGRVLPATDRIVELAAELDDGSVLTGETSIAAAPCPIRRLHLISADGTNAAPALAQTLQEIADADLIIVGPGSLYTSVIPNLLVHRIPEAITGSMAVKAYVCNLMTQPNETLGMSAADHVRAIYEHADLALFDHVLVNRSSVPADVLAQYAAEGAQPVQCDREALEALGLRVIEGGFLALIDAANRKSVHDVVRHRADAVSRALLPIAMSRLLPAISALRAD